METLTLINQAHKGDKASRDRILMENTGLIWSIVKRFMNRGCEGEDLFQIGCIGMLKAIDNFDTGFNVAFSTYAVPMITGEIRRFLRDDGIIKISRKIKENQVKIITETERFRKTEQREPTIEELANNCQLEKEEVLTAIEASRNVESIYKNTDRENEGMILLDKIEDGTNIESFMVNKIMVRQILEMLDEKERKVIILRYFQNKTQSQVAEATGMTQVQVSRLEKKILTSLKNQIDA